MGARRPKSMSTMAISVPRGRPGSSTSHDVTDLSRLRFEALTAAGFSWRQAVPLALADDFDAPLAADLVRRGCPRATAIRIAS